MAATASVVLIIVGIVATSFRYGSRKDLFSYDLRGGTSARVVLKEAMDPEQFRQRLKDRFAGQGEWAEVGPVASGSVIFDVDSSPISADTYDVNTVFRVDTGLKPWEAQDESISELREERKELVAKLDSASGAERETLEDQIKAKTDEIDAKTQRPDDYPEFTEILADVFKDEIVRYELEIDDIKYEPISQNTEASSTTNQETPAEPSSENSSSSNTDSTEEASSGTEESSEASENTSGDVESGGGQSRLQTPSAIQFVSFVAAQDNVSAQDNDPVQEGAASDASAEGTEDAAEEDVVTATADDSVAKERVNAEATLRFKYPISEDGVREAIQQVSETENLSVNADSVGLVEVASLEGSQGTSWRINVKNTSRGDMEKLTAALVGDFEKKPYFRSLADVGGQIAEDAQVQALAAILASLIGIVVYLWFRFHRVIFGLAAVVALVHDVAIVLGVIALSCWLNPVLGTVLLIDNFKISLPVIAAFLTIIGYSLNDTIVVFDRIREVKGKNPKLTGEMLDISISQTLSRTILTSITTLIVVGILYFLGGEAIHAFAFSLVIGVIVGTYSSIFVASPTLYWLAKRTEKG
jgi:preprotein translocase SecF subunit